MCRDLDEAIHPLRARPKRGIPHVRPSPVFFQCGGGVGQYLLGQVRVVDGPGHGDRADEGTEGEDGFAFSGLAVGVAGEVGHHGQAFRYLAGVAASFRAVGTGDVHGNTGHTAAGLGMILVPVAQVAISQVSESGTGIS